MLIRNLTNNFTVSSLILFLVLLVVILLITMLLSRESDLIKKSKIITMKQNGKTDKEIMEEVGCDKKCIKKWSKQYKEMGEEGLIDGRKFNRGPRKTSGLDNLLLRNDMDENPFQSIAESIEKSNLQISVRTGQRRIIESGIFHRPTAKKGELTVTHRQNRLKYANDYLHWTKDQWGLVIWSDEKVL